MKVRSRASRLTIEYIQVIIGASLVGLGYNMFLLPAKLATCGILVVITIFFEMYELSPAFTQLLINIPIFVMAWLTLGRDFSGKSLVATFWVPIIIWLTANIPFAVTIP